jgi:hypothetical protein
LIFTWERESSTGACALRAVAEDYDGFPKHPTLFTDMVPRSVSADRLAVAFVLAFRPFISGGVRFPYDIHPETASAIRDYLAPTTVFISGVDFTPTAIPQSTGVFAVNPEGDYVVDRSWRGFDSNRVIELRIASMGDGFSHHFSDDLLIVPTNASSLGTEVLDVEARALPYIASAVLLSEDFDIGIIRLPIGEPASQTLLGAAALLRSAGLVLQFAG